MTFPSTRLAAVAIALGGALLARPVAAQQLEVCNLVPKEEVKRHLPWQPVLDQFPPEEEPIGTTGSSCNYPTVFVQVLQSSENFINALREQGPLEPIAGVGDEAYFRNNRDTYAEVFVRVGSRIVTLQADGEGKMDTARSGAIELAKVYVAALR